MQAFIKTRAAFRTAWLRPVLDYSLTPDALDAVSSTLRLQGGDIPRETAGSFLAVADGLFLITQVSPGQGFTDFALSDPAEIFTRPRPYTAPEPGVSLGQFLLRELAAGWRDCEDDVYAMPYLRLSTSDETPFVPPTLDANGWYVMTDYLRSVRREYGIELVWTAEPEELGLQIRRRNPAEHTFLAGDGHTFLRANTYSRTATAKVTTVQPRDTGQVDENGEKIFQVVSTDWFLAADGTVSSVEPLSRAFGEWQVITVAAGKTPEEGDLAAQEAAQAAFAKNGETHKVEFWTDFRPRAGDRFRLRLPSGAVFTGDVAAVSRSRGDRRWLIQAGNLATTLTDKVRRAGGSSGGSRGGSGSGQIYAVGDVFITTRPGDPAELLGYGAWDRIQGRFLFAADSSHPAGTRGGSGSHTIAKAELPSDVPVMDSSGFGSVLQGDRTGSTRYYVTSNGGIPTKALGQGESFSLFPPYVSLYVWVRKA